MYKICMKCFVTLISSFSFVEILHKVDNLSIKGICKI